VWDGVRQDALARARAFGDVLARVEPLANLPEPPERGAMSWNADENDWDYDPRIDPMTLRATWWW
jgi:hypothetical protein